MYNSKYEAGETVEQHGGGAVRKANEMVLISPDLGYQWASSLLAFLALAMTPFVSAPSPREWYGSGLLMPLASRTFSSSSVSASGVVVGLPNLDGP